MADQKPQQTVPPAPQELQVVERGNSGYGAELQNLDPFKGRVGRYSTIPSDTTTGKIRTFRAMNGEAKPFDSYIDKPFKLEHVVIHPVDLTDPITGEVRIGARVVLVAPNGEMVGCVSGHIIPALKKAGEVYGPLPWIGGQWIILKRGMSKQKRPFYTMDVPDEKEAAEFQSEADKAEAKAKAKNK